MNRCPAVIIKTRCSSRQKQLIRSLVFRSFRAIPAQFRKKIPQDITILFVPRSFSLGLNRIYKKKNAPANVLSFVYDSYAEIFISPSVVRKEALAGSESYAVRLVKMIIHGMIHCGGIDHERSRRHEKKFEALEQKFLSMVERVM